jgi:hypothetical protein
MRHAVYITYQELFDRYPAQEELNEVIAGLDALMTTIVAARLNTMIRRSVSLEDSKKRFRVSVMVHSEIL